MSMADGTEQTSGAPEVEPQGQTQGTDGQPAGGSNPNWDEFRSEVGDTTFNLLKPHLTKWDQAAQQRIEKVQGDLKRYSSLGDYDTLDTYRTVAQQLDSDPQGFYQALGEELARRGVDINSLTPAQQRAVADAYDDEDGDGDDEYDERDERLSNLEQFIEQQEEQRQAEAMEQQVGSWQSEWDAAFESAKARNPWLADEDDEVLRSLAAPLFTDDDPIGVTFGKAFTNLTNLRTRTLSAPRAGNLAPRLIPSGGGNPAAAQQQDVSKMDRRSTVDLVANILRSSNQ